MTTATELRSLVDAARTLNDEFEENTLGKREPVIDKLADELEQAVTDLEEIQYFIGLARATFINADVLGDPSVEMDAILASIHEPMQLHRFVNRAKMIALDDILSKQSPGRITVLTETLEKERDKYEKEMRAETPNGY